MACNFVTSKCNTCKNFVLSTEVALSGTNLVVTIPQNSYANDSEVCIAIAQPIPTGVSAANPVVIQIGTATTQYPLINRCGHDVYADQVCTRKIYCTRVAADNGFFVYNGRCNLPCTDHIFPAALPTTTTATASASTNSIASI